MITHVASAVLYVADQEESLAFYRDILGFGVITDADMGGGRRWLEVRPRGAQTAISLLSAAAFGRAPGEGANLTFVSDDVRATVEVLRANGADVSDPSVSLGARTRLSMVPMVTRFSSTSGRSEVSTEPFKVRHIVSWSGSGGYSQASRTIESGSSERAVAVSRL